MPSWNMHTAIASEFLDQSDPLQFGVRDANAFLFGNYVPDIYVGYMVDPITKHIAYTETHIAEAVPIPIPDAAAFWQRYIAPSVAEKQPVDDIVLGSWAHLYTDAFLNDLTRKLLEQKHIPTGECARLLKQHDFEKFGRSLSYNHTCEVNDALLEQCQRFPQYSIEPADVQGAVDKAAELVEICRQTTSDEIPELELFEYDQLKGYYDQLHEDLSSQLEGYAKAVGLR